MNVIFSYVHPTRSQKSLGPFESISLSFDGMRADAGRALVAPYRNHQWAVEGLDYFRLDCTDRWQFISSAPANARASTGRSSDSLP